MEKQDLHERREQERAPVEMAGGGESEGAEQNDRRLERFASHEETGGGESDQLPEEAPDEVVEDDAGDDARDDAEDSPGAADDSDPDQATGNP